MSGAKTTNEMTLAARKPLLDAEQAAELELGRNICALSQAYPHELTNAELAVRHAAGAAPVILDVREEQEYAAGHIPGAVLVPMETIESGPMGLDPNAETAVISRSGRRSDYACQILSRNGFANVKNIVPGMSAWTGPITKWLCQQEG